MYPKGLRRRRKLESIVQYFMLNITKKGPRIHDCFDFRACGLEHAIVDISWLGYYLCMHMDVRELDEFYNSSKTRSGFGS